MIKCLVMFSGGLDSIIAAHLLKNQGIEVLGLHFVLPFYSGLGIDHHTVGDRSRMLGIPLRIEEEGEEFLAMFKDPAFGYGKNINPCLDCRIHRLSKAALIMRQEQAAFIATGEVVGQRPMSQRRDCLDIVEKRSGLRGLLLRPLSAGLLRPTIPENEGWVDRNKLLSIGGRGRKDQMAYATAHGLSYPSPGGGCLLTHEQTTRRFGDLMSCSPGFSLTDFKLLAFGRHFRISREARLVIARDDGENTVLEKLLCPDDYCLTMADVLGPLGILRATGPARREELEKACSLIARYSKARSTGEARVAVSRNGTASAMTIHPAREEECEACRL
jgi:tRNA-uridine 2-sulfurtransferase